MLKVILPNELRNKIISPFNHHLYSKSVFCTLEYLQSANNLI